MSGNIIALIIGMVILAAALAYFIWRSGGDVYDDAKKKAENIEEKVVGEADEAFDKIKNKVMSTVKRE